MRQFFAAAIFVIATMVTPPDWVVSDEIGPSPFNQRIQCGTCI